MKKEEQKRFIIKLLLGTVIMVEVAVAVLLLIKSIPFYIDVKTKVPIAAPILGEFLLKGLGIFYLAFLLYSIGILLLAYFFLIILMPLWTQFLDRSLIKWFKIPVSEESKLSTKFNRLLEEKYKRLLVGLVSLILVILFVLLLMDNFDSRIFLPQLENLGVAFLFGLVVIMAMLFLEAETMCGLSAPSRNKVQYSQSILFMAGALYILLIVYIMAMFSISMENYFLTRVDAHVDIFANVTANKLNQLGYHETSYELKPLHFMEWNFTEWTNKVMPTVFWWLVASVGVLNMILYIYGTSQKPPSKLRQLANTIVILTTVFIIGTIFKYFLNLAFFSSDNLNPLLIIFIIFLTSSMKQYSKNILFSKICPICGYLIDRDSLYCKKCGNSCTK